MKPVHGVRSVRYYSLSNEDLSTLAVLDGIVTVCFSMGTGFFFTILTTPDNDPKYWLYQIASAGFLIAGVVLFFVNGAKLRAVKREHDFPEDKITIPEKIGRYVGGFGRGWRN